MKHKSRIVKLAAACMLFSSCARMGNPDGGWYDETPPQVVGATPQENATNVTQKKIRIDFSEYIKLENASEKVMVSPPQHELPEIKATGKHIFVNLLDSLIPNTTYTVDFSDGIVDNNEGNPLGNYTYTFSTGDAIDTMEVAGYVLEAKSLEPVKGILVGVMPKEGSDSLVGKRYTRVSRTDSRGHFIIRGIASGEYTIGAVKDADGDYAFTQRGEMMAYSKEVIVPSSKPDVRQDTLWADANHIKDITLVPYTHFMPDEVVLRAFDHQMTDRQFLKVERKQPEYFTLFFTAPVAEEHQKEAMLPQMRLLEPEATNPFIVEHSLKADTVTYWLRDTALVNTDTLRVEMTTYITDTLGVQQLKSDTLEILSKIPYAKRLKEQKEKEEEWQKTLAKKLKKSMPGEVIDTVMPKELLVPVYNVPQKVTPVGALAITFPRPLARMDTTAVHLYVEQDSLWYRAPFVMQPTGLKVKDETAEGLDGSGVVPYRQYEVFTEWIPGALYSFEVDSLAFEDIYGRPNGKYKAGLKVGTVADYSSLFVNVTGAPDGVPVIVQMMNQSDGIIASTTANEGTAEFYYIPQGSYYLKAFLDRNNNGEWDTGDYFKDQQPEEVYYLEEAVECKAKWDVTKAWNLTARPLYRQKPAAITKQKPEAEKTIKHRNAERAKEKGIVYTGK